MNGFRFLSLCLLCALLCCPPAFAEGRTVLVVADLAPAGVPEKDAKAITDLLRGRLVKQRKFTVVERSQMEKLAKEVEFQMSGCTDVGCAVELGQMLNADKVVVGGVTELMGRLLVSARIVDLAQAKVEFEEEAETTAALADLCTAMDDLALRLAGRLPLVVTVQAVQDGSLWLDAGSLDGLAQGQRLTAFRQVVLRGADNRPVLESSTAVGELELVAVNPNTSQARKIKGEVAPGDFARVGGGHVGANGNGNGNGSADRRTLIEAVQRELTRLGHDVGRPDGIFGRRTTTAIRAFQTAAGLPADGLATAELLERLQAAAAGAAVAAQPPAPTPMGSAAVTGTLVVLTEPAGQTVKVDGKALATPTPVSVKLPSGAHSVELSWQGESLARDVKIPIEDKLVLELDLAAEHRALEEQVFAVAEALGFLEAFLQRFPQGAHADAARGLVADHRDWETARAEDTVAAYRRYASAQPRGLHSGEAASAEERKAWAGARAAGTLEGYRGFLTSYPRGAHRAEAERAADDLAWEAVRRGGREADYRGYAADYPRGEHRAQAEAWLDDAAWEAARRRNTLKGHFGYLAEYPAGRHREEAKGVVSPTDPVTGMELVCLQGGTFEMGDTFGDGGSDEKPVRSVTVSDFCLGKTEVTQAQWQKVMGTNPSKFQGADRPVEEVSWNDAQEFVCKLNQQSGKTYRLPTEAEWEYAARSGGKKEKWAGTSSEAELGQYAWYDKNSGSQTHPVGTKQANGLGLHDMSGNVWEWCQDWCGDYSSSSQRDPTGPSSGQYRVYRGGSWNYGARGARAANRDGDSPGDRINYLGFRLALVP